MEGDYRTEWWDLYFNGTTESGKGWPVSTKARGSLSDSVTPDDTPCEHPHVGPPRAECWEPYLSDPQFPHLSPSLLRYCNRGDSLQRTPGTIWCGGTGGVGGISVKALKIAIAVLVVSSVPLVGVLGTATGTASASSAHATDDGLTDVEDADVERQEIVVSDLVVSVSDTHIRGTGLPDESIDEATYTVEDSTIRTDGFTITYQDQTYHVGAIDVTIDNVGLSLENVSIGDEASDS